MFLSPNGLMVVSIIKGYQELESLRLTSLFLVVFFRNWHFESTVRYAKLNPAVMAQWLGCRTRNHKVASSSPATAMSSFGDWFTQP